MPTKASISQMKYDKDHTRYYGLKLNLTTDADIIEKLTTVGSMQGYIKQLIRADMQKTNCWNGDFCPVCGKSKFNWFTVDSESSKPIGKWNFCPGCGSNNSAE